MAKNKTYNDGIDDAVERVTHLLFALRTIGGTPTNKDLIKLAKRIKSLKSKNPSKK